MRRMKLSLIVLGMVALMIGMAAPVMPSVEAQEDPAVLECQAAVNAAFENLGNNCADTGPNQICYGSGEVYASFADSSFTGFALPGDKANLRDLVALNSNPYVEGFQGDSFGLVLIRMYANLPNGTNELIDVVVSGDTDLLNAVDPALAIDYSAAPVEVTIAAAAETAELKLAAFDAAPMVGTVEAGTVLMADQIVESGDWVRVQFASPSPINPEFTLATAWAKVQDLEGFDTANLAVIGPDSESPLQTFFFETSPAVNACAEAEPRVLINTPEGLQAQVNYNGSTYFLGSLSESQAEGGVTSVNMRRGTTVAGPIVSSDPTAQDSVPADNEFVTANADDADGNSVDVNNPAGAPDVSETVSVAAPPPVLDIANQLAALAAVTGLDIDDPALLAATQLLPRNQPVTTDSLVNAINLVAARTGDTELAIDGRDTQAIGEIAEALDELPEGATVEEVAEAISEAAPTFFPTPDSALAAAEVQQEVEAEVEEAIAEIEEAREAAIEEAQETATDSGDLQAETGEVEQIPAEENVGVLELIDNLVSGEILTTDEATETIVEGSQAGGLGVEVGEELLFIGRAQGVVSIDAPAQVLWDCAAGNATATLLGTANISAEWEVLSLLTGDTVNSGSLNVGAGDLNGRWSNGSTGASAEVTFTNLTAQTVSYLVFGAVSVDTGTDLGEQEIAIASRQAEVTLTPVIPAGPVITAQVSVSDNGSPSTSALTIGAQGTMSGGTSYAFAFGGAHSGGGTTSDGSASAGDASLGDGAYTTTFSVEALCGTVSFEPPSSVTAEVSFNISRISAGDPTSELVFTGG